MNKKLAIGIDDFKKIISEDYYFVDKSLFIKEIINEEAQTIFIPRPRRFGKTLNLSMLKYFLTNENREKNRELFRELKIYKEKEFDHQGKYPIIHLSFKDIKETNWENCYNKVKYIIQNLFDTYEYLLDSDKLSRLEKRTFEKILFGEGDKAIYEESIKLLSQILSKYYNEEVYILIDEYDQPIVSSYTNEYYKEGISFFRNLYSAALKDNQYLRKGVLTGILRISKESIFSGLNNLYVDSLVQNRFNYFGLTEEEVKEILEKYRMSYELEEVKEWYNGYVFGKETVYNPWSIINYIKNKELKAYWVNTSSNDLIKELLINSSYKEYDSLLKLAKGETLELIIDELSSFDGFENLDKRDPLLNLMLFSGYLTIINKNKVKLPNKEVKEFYKGIFKTNANAGNSEEFNTILKKLINGEVEEFKKRLKELFLKALSYYDSDKESEKYYHNLILGLALGLDEYYIIHSNREYGTGRVDLLLKSKDGKLPNYIFEFKVSYKEENLKELAKKALEQIEEKKYDIEIENPIKIGMAFYKKEFEMVYKSEEKRVSSEKN
jgi:hypothetical protein